VAQRVRRKGRQVAGKQRRGRQIPLPALHFAPIAKPSLRLHLGEHAQPAPYSYAPFPLPAPFSLRCYIKGIYNPTPMHLSPSCPFPLLAFLPTLLSNLYCPPCLPSYTTFKPILPSLPSCPFLPSLPTLLSNLYSLSPPLPSLLHSLPYPLYLTSPCCYLPTLPHSKKYVHLLHILSTIPCIHEYNITTIFAFYPLLCYNTGYIQRM